MGRRTPEGISWHAPQNRVKEIQRILSRLCASVPRQRLWVRTGAPACQSDPKVLEHGIGNDGKHTPNAEVKVIKNRKTDP